MSKSISHPIFLSCCKYEEDPFWKGIFQDLAYNITPSNTYIFNDSLTLIIPNGSKTSRISYSWKGKEVEIVFKDVKDLFIKYNITSSINESAILLDSMKKHMENVNTSWSSIKKKCLKEMIVKKYVLKLTSEYSLSQDESANLYNMLQTGLMVKTITNKDIVYSEGCIQDILNLEWNEEHKIFELKTKEVKESKDKDVSQFSTFQGISGLDVSKSEESCIQLVDGWYKQLSNMKKNYSSADLEEE